MKEVLKELFEMPFELYCRTDSKITESMRPTTQKLDSKNSRYKYFIGNNAAILNIFDILTGFDTFDVTPIGVSTINYLANCFGGLVHPIWGKHKGYTENSDGKMTVDNSLLFYGNIIANKTKLLSVIEGSTELGVGLYMFFVEKDSSETTQFLIYNGLKALNVGLGTYLYQADDETPRKNKQMFPNTKEKLEEIIMKPKPVPLKA